MYYNILKCTIVILRVTLLTNGQRCRFHNTYVRKKKTNKYLLLRKINMPLCPRVSVT